MLGLCQRTRLIDYGKTDSLVPPAPGKHHTAFYVCESDCLEERLFAPLVQSRELLAMGSLYLAA